MSQGQLGELIGATAQQVGLLERNERGLKDKWIHRLTRALGVSTSDLFEEGRGDTYEIAQVSWQFAGVVDIAALHQHQEDVATIPVAGLEHDGHIALVVEDDSMDRIAPKAAVIVVDLTDREPKPGKEYLFRTNGQTLFRRWRTDPDRLEPYSSNPEHETIFPRDEIVVIGRVTKAITDL